MIFAQEGGQFDVNYMEKPKKPTKGSEKKKTVKMLKKSTFFPKNIFDEFFRICSFAFFGTDFSLFSGRSLMLTH